MENKFNVQVNQGYYHNAKYNDLERFISYYYQIKAISSLPVKEVLEIGIGANVTSNYLKTLGIKVSTCDFDASLQPDIVADIRNIPVPDKSFDAVAAFQILEHLPFEEFEKILIELKRASRNYVVVSLPFRCSYFEFIFKFPFIRTLLKRNFIDLTLRKGVRFPGMQETGQHYWEIDQHKFKLKDFKKIIYRHFNILDEFSPILDKYHYFFVLQNKQ